MATFTESPFAALTVIVAPAILTNASSVLSLGTGNRIARVVDRTRVLAAGLAAIDPASPRAAAYRAHLERLKLRAHLLLRALRWFYTSIGAFAAAALISVVGSVLASSMADPIFQILAALGLLAGAVGVAGLVIGGVVMARETRLAVQFLEQEVEFIQAREHSPA
ncbi:MAG: hypothetical protein ABS36_10970 [Acidobacteria bacterium SCN 69-37]|nr:MAG: hypothetical protein ABS36_10970 [Acidobacteria bacterium SCN 69-37]